MLAFVIPLISKQYCRDWNRACTMLSRVIQALYRQTDDRFEIIVVCHDKPDIATDTDSRLHIIEADRPPPEAYVYKLTTRDQRMKNRCGALTAMSHGATHVMTFDADDFLNINVVAHVLANPDKDGFYVDEGYEYDYPTQRLYKRTQLHSICGSTFIFNCKSFFGSPPEQENVDRHYVHNGHSTFLTMSREINKNLEPLPFPALLYTLNHGQNQAARMGIRAAGRGWKHFAKFQILGKPVNDDTRKLFGLAE